jgi:hypothetical protein
MTKAIKIVMVVVLVMVTIGQAKLDLEDIVKDMNERLALNEAKLIKNQEDLKKTQEDLKKTQKYLKKSQEDLKQTQEDLKNYLEDLKKNQEDLQKTQEGLGTTNIQLEGRLKIAEDDQIATQDDLAATKDELTATKDVLNVTRFDLAATKNPPFFHACGSHSAQLSISSQTIPYSSLLYSSTNTDGGDLDIDTGIFSCPYPGSWTVTWSLMASDTHGDHEVKIYLRKNGENIDESYNRSIYTGSGGVVYEHGKNITQPSQTRRWSRRKPNCYGCRSKKQKQIVKNRGILKPSWAFVETNIIIIPIYYVTGGRTLVLHLDRGDTLDLYCEDCSADIYDTTFCVTLSTFDIE